MIRTALPILMLLCSGLLFFLYIDPTYTDAQAVKAEVAEYDNALTKSKELQKIRDTLLAKYNTFSTEDLKRLQLLLPDNVDTIRLVLDIDTIAARYGMVIKNLKLNADKRAAQGSLGPEGSNVQSVELGFAVATNYETFLTFIRDLQDSLRIIDLGRITFTVGSGASSEKNTDPNITTYAVTIHTYWLP